MPHLAAGSLRSKSDVQAGQQFLQFLSSLSPSPTQAGPTGFGGVPLTGFIGGSPSPSPSAPGGSLPVPPSVGALDPQAGATAQRGGKSGVDIGDILGLGAGGLSLGKLFGLTPGPLDLLGLISNATGLTGGAASVAHALGLTGLSGALTGASLGPVTSGAALAGATGASLPAAAGTFTPAAGATILPGVSTAGEAAATSAGASGGLGGLGIGTAGALGLGGGAALAALLIGLKKAGDQPSSPATAGFGNFQDDATTLSGVGSLLSGKPFTGTPDEIKGSFFQGNKNPSNDPKIEQKNLDMLRENVGGLFTRDFGPEIAAQLLAAFMNPNLSPAQAFPQQVAKLNSPTQQFGDFRFVEGG